jgi:hypothetical protein
VDHVDAVVVGGAGNFVTAWERLLAERGVVVHTGRRGAACRSR